MFKNNKKPGRILPTLKFMFGIMLREKPWFIVIYAVMGLATAVTSVAGIVFPKLIIDELVVELAVLSVFESLTIDTMLSSFDGFSTNSLSPCREEYDLLLSIAFKIIISRETCKFDFFLRICV